jgi:hypothetical protein
VATELIKVATFYQETPTELIKVVTFIKKVGGFSR